LIHADGKIILLDEDGTLGIVTVSPQGNEGPGPRDRAREHLVDAADALRHDAYVRDRKNIAAFNLGS
jgi:hypothetical protein